MNQSPTCPVCGGPLAHGACSGLCPACLLHAAMPDDATRHQAPGEAGAEQPTTSMSEQSGTRIGRCKLLEKIGEGGFGVVWMAEQDEPVRRRVALKILKLGMDTREVVARFEAERQALALMEHPNIASVFDGGATATGRPYFVMELVKGVPITTYCDANHLTTKERLALFMEVCHAVQHAHQKGVIHRDLKPSNILVTVKDDRPVPKVIDFGIAKATQATLTEKTLFTRLNQWIGTPAYMSPEQAGLGSLDVDTRSDIYSLGVLLYELLTGHPPFDPENLLAAGYDAVMKVIREEDPPKPSTRLSTLAGDELHAVAAKRGAEPAKLDRLVRGDLDWIVMKALEKDRQRRYETAKGLADDLQRHLDNEPVLARPPSTAHRMKKAWRRNRIWASAAAVVAGALILGAVLSFWQAVEANRATDLAADARQAAEEENAGRKRQLREAAHSDRLLAMELFSQDRDADAFAHLARACEYDPESTLAAETAIFRLNVLNVARQVSILHGAGAFPLEPIDRSESFRRRDEREDQEVSEAVFTPDGSQVVTRSWNSWRGAALLWDAGSGRMLRELPEPAAAPGTGDIRGLEVNGSHLAFDQPWEKGLADSGPIPSPDGAAELMFEPEGTVLRRKGGHDERIILAPPTINDHAIARFSPDGRWVATGAVDHQVMLHPTRIQQFERHGGPTIEKLTGPDGSAQLTLHAAQSGDRLALLPGHAGHVNRVRFSADNTRVVTASDDTTARVWETADRRLLQRFGGLGREMLWSLEFSPDDRLLLGETDNRLLTWDALTGELLRDFAVQGKEGERLAASSDSKVVVVRESGEGKAGAVQLWDGVKHGRLARLGNRDLAVDRAAFSPDDRLLATHEMDGTIRIWDGGNGRPVSETPTAVVELSQLCFSPDSRHLLVVSMSKDDVECPSLLIEAASGRVLFKLDIGRYDILSASFHPSGTLLATGSNDGEARIWECPSGRLVATLPHHLQTVTSIEFSPDGKLVATACWRSTIVQVWSVDGWQRVTRIRNPQYHLVERIAFSPDSRLLAASSDRADELVVWEARSGETLAAIDIPQADYRDVAFSHDGKRLALSRRNPSGGPVVLEVPCLTEPVPPWFPDFLRILLVRTIDHDGGRRVLTPLEWEALHVKVTAAAAADRSRYGELVRWFLAPAAHRPVRPGDTLTRREVADRLVTPAAGPVQLQRALAFDPANPLAHLALARFEEDPQAADFLRQWARQQLPPTPPTELRQRIDAIDTAPTAGAPEPSDR